MEGNMKENMMNIESKDMVYLNGLMVKFIKDIGKMESKMEKENFIFLRKKNGKVDFGKREKELNGILVQTRIYIYKIFF